MDKFRISALLVLISMLFAWSKTPYSDSPEWEKPEVHFPADNPLTDESVELGGALFFETLLSKDTTLSCQSCHLLNTAFADHLAVGVGIKGRAVTRNTPTLFNIGLHPYFMMDGKFNSLEEQVLGPVNDHREFEMSPQEVTKRLAESPVYQSLSKKAYGEEISFEIVQKALANFERVLTSENSRFDQFKRGEIELSSEELEGWELFQSNELNCIACHSGFNFTNYAFENNGLKMQYLDEGRKLVTHIDKDEAKFKVPTLRNISLTAPYMHDGSFETLESIIDHYSKGGVDHPSKSKLIKGFELTSHQKTALICFLNSLTEERLLNQE